MILNDGKLNYLHHGEVHIYSSFIAILKIKDFSSIIYFIFVVV